MSAKIYSVKQLNAYIDTVFKNDMVLPNVSVEGEFSKVTNHSSGHTYFTLKGEGASLDGVMFAGMKAKGLKAEIKVGAKVIIRGNVAFYQATGRVELIAYEITAQGDGELYRKFLELKQKLSDMGFFDPQYKKPIPKYATRIGVVTSKTGAVLQDIERTVHARNPYIELLLVPALVQGENAPDSLISALEKIDSQKCDVIIVGRGGGSAEDLWCFNDERLARTIFNLKTPVISAVGHETDFTIADFVADARALTPTAGAEMAAFEYRVWKETIEHYLGILENETVHQWRMRKSDLEVLKSKLEKAHPCVSLNSQKEKVGNLKKLLPVYWNRIFSEKQNRIGELKAWLPHYMKAGLEKKENEFQLLAKRLEGESPLKKLVNGFGFLKGEKGPLKSVHEVSAGETLTVTISDGTIQTIVESVKEN